MKVIYLNKETGKEVHYGESITFKESGKLANGYSYQSMITLPIINETIPDLINKGVLVQKEVKDIEDNKLNNKALSELTIERELNILVTAVSILIEQMQQLQKDFYGEKTRSNHD